MNFMRLKLLLVTLLILLMGACSTPKDVAYFQGVDNLPVSQIEAMAQYYDTKIAPDD